MTSPQFSRRSVLKTSAGLAGFAGLTGLAVSQARGNAVPASPVLRGSAVPLLRGSAAGTTLARTFRLGAPGAKGYRRVVTGPGEPHLLRRDLGGVARAARTATRRGLLTFAHLTDIHMVDTQSPARVEWIDRSNDPGSGLEFLPVAGAYRPQELLTTQVAEAMVRAVNKVGRGPVTGASIAFSISTGDAADNAQHNEVRWVIDVLDGKRVRPDSGDPRKYEGVMDWTGYDRRYWHPEGAPPGAAADLPASKHGFPVVKGLLNAARAPFQATGLNAPWLAVLGNHDVLLQGNLPPLPLLNAMATGGIKITAPGSEAAAKELAAVFRKGDARALARMAQQQRTAGLFRMVTPDARRRILSRPEIVREHFTTSGLKGHGFTQANLRAGTGYYTFTKGLVRGIVLDTNNPAGYADGSLDRTQFKWLEAQLKAASSRYLAADGREVRHAVQDRLLMIFSHHTLDTMNNFLGGGRVLGDEIEALLLRFPNVVLWVNGHTHVNEVVAHKRPSGGGFWEVSTAAHIDWPQQSRVIELTDNTDGTLSIFTTVVDSAAPASFGGRLTDPTRLASLSRELSGNDWQENGDARRGKPEDRNVELLVPAPF